MAGSSLSPRELRSKETSPNPPLLLTRKPLTPRLPLPPILSDRTTSSSAEPPRPPPSSPEPWSYYHRHCQRSPKQAQSRRQENPKKCTRARCRYPEDIEVIRRFLDDNPGFLFDYIAEEVPATRLEDCLRIKRQLDGTSPETASIDYDISDETRTPNTFKFCTDYVSKDNLSDWSEETVPSPPIPRRKLLKRDGIVRYDGPNMYVHAVKRQQQPIRTRTRTGSPLEGPIDPGSAPKVTVQMAADNSPGSLLALSALEVSKQRPSRSKQSKVPPVQTHVVQKLQKPDSSSANGQTKTRRLFPVQGFVYGSERQRACFSSCINPRKLHLAKPVLDNHKKNVTAMVENLLFQIVPNALIEMYLVDQQRDLYCLLRKQLEKTNFDHERIIRRVIAEGMPRFLNRRDLPRLLRPPKHMMHYFNKNYNVALIPLHVNFGNIVIEVWGKTFSTQATMELQCLQRIIGMTLPYHQQYQSLLQDSQMSEFLLEVAQAVFEEMISLDQLIKKILEVAQRLVSADRASLFLVDHKNLELVSTVFDLRYEANQDTEFCRKEIRIPINKGIAGHVAKSGETMNIPDAYLDERFNKAVDEATGYHTVSILCMPIKVRGEVLAVVQMVNKRDRKEFGPDDESAFQGFSTFFGLALHHAKLYDKIKRKEQKYKVALEVLGYHNTCSEEDVTKLLEERTKDGKVNYNDFALNPFEVNEIDKCKGILNMFEDLFDMTKFDLAVLTRFVLTVKKNYRKVPYHNFDHGWAVANTMYVMLKNDTDNRFDFNNRLALFVACLCHDLDHRGYTNKFMSEIASPLAAIYTTSTLEHHHFNMTVTILQQDGHNILYQMSGEEYKDVLDSIRQCILATDLAAFFPNLKKINELVFETPQFDWDDAGHRKLGMSFCMTGADLSASAKPFAVQMNTVDIIVTEFYQQGDLERLAGRSPVPMMDRQCQDQVPVCQVGFISQICLPCYRVLAKLFPSTTPMLEMVTVNLETWKGKALDIHKNNEESEEK